MYVLFRSYRLPKKSNRHADMFPMSVLRLQDVLDKVAQLFIRLATAHTTFADHDEQYRNMFKSIRTREESLMQLKKSKESLDGKILSLEKKVCRRCFSVLSIRASSPEIC